MKLINKYIVAVAAATMTLGSYAAEKEMPAVSVSDVNVTNTNGQLNITMSIDASNVSLSSARQLKVQPVLVGKNNTEYTFPAVYLAGKSNFYQHERAGDIQAPDQLMRAKDAGVFAYAVSVPYQDWMEVSTLYMTNTLGGCNCSNNESPVELAQHDYTPLVFEPEIVTVEAQVTGVKTREVSGSANIAFPVNRAEILTAYRRNPEELAKIRKSIDFVKDDADAQITSITIRGYASPDGPYANNERLAKARTEALVNYVQNLYSFPASIMHSAWVAEDWAGLRKYLEESDMEQRTAIIAVIDSDLAPDAKEQKIKKDFPKDYAFLLKNVYPGLRHTDYTVEYVIRTYTDVNEIAQIMKTSPNKLSLDELYLLGKSLNPESDEYAQVYDLAVRMYPSEPIANLNAAMVSMRRGDYAKTQEYLTKAGDSDQANYARGLLLAYNEQYEPALMTLTPLASKMPEAAQAVAQIQKILARLAK